MNEYLELGKELSENYILNGQDLTLGLKKLANLNVYNPQQLKRIAENANIETYLKLAEVSPDGYVEFAVADSSGLIEEAEVSIKKEAGLLMAKDNIWEDLKSRHQNALVEEIGEFTKVASFDADIHPAEVARRTADITQRVSEVRGYQVDLDSNYRTLENMVKSAMAEGYEFSELTAIIKEATSEEVSSLLVPDLERNMKEAFPLKDLTKIANHNNINTGSGFYKLAESIDSGITTMSKIYEDILKEAQYLMSIADRSTKKHYIKEALVKVAALGKTLKTVGLTALVALPTGALLNQKAKNYKNNKAPEGANIQG